MKSTMMMVFEVGGVESLLYDFDVIITSFSDLSVWLKMRY